jgi:hypothetical protein
VRRAEDYLWSSAHPRSCLDTIVETADKSGSPPFGQSLAPETWEELTSLG